jgi:hypothetical protein
MIQCSKIRPLLALSAGGDLGKKDDLKVSLHLAGCSGCREEAAEFASMIRLAGRAGAVQFELPTGVRNRIALEAAGRARRGVWVFPFPASLAFSGRPTLLAAAGALLAGLLSLPILMRAVPGTPRHGTEVTRIDVMADAGVVRLAWSDGKKSSYRVYKSPDPRDFSKGQVHLVRGNVWTDAEPGSARIVFYRID